MLTHVSLPLLNKCYHFTLVEAGGSDQLLNASDEARLFFHNLYTPSKLASNANASTTTNVDIPLLESIDFHLLMSLLNTLGITQLNSKCNDTNDSQFG